jgi:hypothetical protein
MLTPWRNSNQRYSPENATYTGKVIIEQGQWTDLHMYILTKKIGKNEYNFFLTLQFCEGIKKLASSWYVQTNSHIHRKLPSNKTSVEIRTNSHLHTPKTPVELIFAWDSNRVSRRKIASRVTRLGELSSTHWVFFLLWVAFWKLKKYIHTYVAQIYGLQFVSYVFISTKNGLGYVHFWATF